MLASSGSAWRILKRITDPSAYARMDNNTIPSSAHFPITECSSGAMIKKPLPIMEANGVTVARHWKDCRKRGRHNTIAISTEVASAMEFVITVCTP
ncbi:hypothetical protein ALT1545_280037 [Alteromonas macleodii]